MFTQNSMLIYVKIRTIVIRDQHIFWKMKTRGVESADTEVCLCLFTDKKEENTAKNAVSASWTAEVRGRRNDPLKVYKTWKSNKPSFWRTTE